MNTLVIKIMLYIVVIIFQMIVIKYMHMICESIWSTIVVSLFNDS